MSKWESLYRSKPDGWTHVHPHDDIRPHRTGEDDTECECNPRLEVDVKLVVHFAFDGRDIIERVERGQDP